MLNEKQIAQFKEALIRQKLELEHWLNDSAEATNIVTLDQSKVGRLSRMDALQQQAMAQASTTQYKEHLQQIIRALRAIEDGDYGFCEECGEDIPTNRLEAKPESVYCLSCKTKLEEG